MCLCALSGFEVLSGVGGVGAHNQLLCEGTVLGPSKKAAQSLQSRAAGVGGALTGTVCPVGGRDPCTQKEQLGVGSKAPKEKEL